MNRNHIGFLKWFIPLVAVFISPFSYDYLSNIMSAKDPEILWAKHYSHEDLNKAEVCPSEELKGHKFFFYNKSKYSETVAVTTKGKVLKVATNPVTAFEITSNANGLVSSHSKTFLRKKI